VAQAVSKSVNFHLIAMNIYIHLTLKYFKYIISISIHFLAHMDPQKAIVS